MPELPEIASRAREMQQHLTGRKVTQVEVLQPKCLNEPTEAFQEHITGAVIRSTSNRGKWILTELDKGWLLINLGMGGEILLRKKGDLPPKYRIGFDFLDGEVLSVNFWWFGFSHYCSSQELTNHPQISKLGKNALDVNVEELGMITGHRKTAIKTIILDQTNIAGIGNAYIHDILFMARLHPLRPANSLSALDLENLHEGIHRGLEPSLAKGGAFYEMNLFGEKGGFQFEDIQVGYREGQPCPVCQTSIVKIKTGSTSSFICPHCQPL